MSEVDFGDEVVPGSVLANLLSTAPKTGSVAATLLLLDRYETVYGIFNHDADDASRPLALVAMHPAEDPHTGDTLFELMKTFADLEINKHFGCSWKEFLEYPRDHVEMMKEVARERQNAGHKTAKDLLDQLNPK